MRVGGDGSDVLAVLDKLRGNVKSAVQDLERTTASVELFKTTKQRVEETGAAFMKLTDKASSFRQQIAQIEGAGGKVGKDLTDALKATERQLSQTSKEYNRQSASLDKLSVSLRKAGVDTTKLAVEEERLAAATREAARQQQVLSAQQTLGVKSFKETQAEIAKLNAAYQTLKANGATTNELALAQRNLTTQIRELQTNTGTLADRFVAARGAVLGIAAAFTGAALAAKAAADAALEFEKATAQIGTVSNITEGQVADLTDGIRSLSQTAGFDLKEGLQAAYDLLRQGVPAGNILEVLATADEAAKAGITDLGTAAKLTGTLITSFGVEASNVKGTLDGLFVAAKNGGATFEELASGLGDLAPVARATRTPIEQVAAAVQVMTQAGLDAPSAISQLQQILTRLAQPETVAKLRELGITAGDLIGTLRQIGERNLSLGAILDLGVSSTRAAGGIAALTSNARGLADAMTAIGNSSGAIDTASEALSTLHAESIERLVATLKSLQITLGQIVTPTTQTINSLQQLLQLLDTISRRGVAAAAGLTGIGKSAVDIATQAARALNPVNALGVALDMAGESARIANEAFAEASKAQESLGDAEQQIASQVAGQAQAASASFAKLKENLAAIIPILDATGKAITQSTQASIDAINTQAANAIAGLDKLTNSEKAIAEQTIAIQTDAAAKRLAVLQKGAADAIGLAEAEGKRRVELARQQGADIAKVEQDVAKDKQSVLAGIAKQYQAHLADLLKLETEHLNNVAKLNQQRVDFNKSIEDKIRDIRGESLSAFEQYAKKITEIDENIAKSREALAKGDLTRAEDYAKKAIELSGGIAKAVEQDGRQIVGTYEAQGIAIGKIRAAQDLYNKALDERVAAEKEGAEASAENLQTTQEQLDVVKSKLAEVTAIVDKGIEVTITTNAAEEVERARQEILALDGLNTSSTHTIHVVTTEGNATGGIVGEKIAALRARTSIAQRYARGGSVFRRPTWAKVPGSGDGDTVPAGLQAGSFVVRKAASRYYGDSLLGSLNRVQHFAVGGLASPLAGGAASSLPMLGRKLSDIVLGGSLGGLGGGRKVDGVDIMKLQRELTAIQEAGRSLPHSSTGLDVGKWAAALLERIPFLTDAKLKVLADFVDDEVEGILAGITQARAFGVPSVVGEKLLGWLFLNRGGQARGTDTVPAMLTPGEWVIRKPAVDHFGAGLLHAINGMRIPKEALARMVRGPAAPQPTRYYADGGPVAVNGGTGNASRSDPFNSQPVTVNIYTTGQLTPEEVRRTVIPTIRNEMRRRF